MPLSPFLEPAAKFARAAQALAEGPGAVKLARSPRKLIGRDGRTSLYRYAPTAKSAGAPPVLIVYALINKPTILDLLPGRSVVQALLGAGHAVYLLDWGTPGPEAADEGLEAHVLGYLDRAVDSVRRDAKSRRVSLLGYCMGGTLSVMYSALKPEKVERLLAAVAPIRGRQSEGLLHVASRPELFDPAMLAPGALISAEAMNAAFTCLRPVENLWGKYVRYFEHADDPAFTELFFAMERWLTDGAPLPGRLYRDYVRAVYQQDLLLGAGVPIGAKRARAADVKCPVLVMASTYDHLVPPSSAKALLEKASSREKKYLEFAGGHVGLAISPKALTTVWVEAAEWLKGAPKNPRKRSRALPSKRRP
jgi:polyhydroxyalkanoate synthase